MKNYIRLYTFSSLIMFCGAVELDWKKEAMFLPENLDYLKAKDTEIIKQLIEQVAKSNDLVILKKAATAITSETYTNQKFTQLKKMEITPREIQRPLMLDLLYRLRNGVNPNTLFANRLLSRKKINTNFKGRPSQFALIYKSFLLSEYDYINLAAKYLKKGTDGSETISAGLIFTQNLKTEAAKKAVLGNLEDIARSDWGELYLEAISQLVQYDSDKVVGVLQTKIEKPMKLSSQSYTGTAKIICDKATYTTHESRINQLTELYQVKRPERSYVLALFVKLAKKDKLYADLINEKVPIVGAIQSLDQDDSVDILAMLKKWNQTETLVALHEILKSNKFDEQIAQWILQNDWSNANARQLALVLGTTKNVNVSDILLKNTELILDARNTEMREELLWQALESNSILKNKQLLTKLTKLISSGDIAINRSYYEIAGLIKLGIRARDENFHKGIKKLLDETHPLYQHLGATVAANLYTHVLFEVGNVAGMATECETQIIDGLNSRNVIGLNVGAASALKSWPKDKMLSDELKQAVSLNLLDEGDAVTSKSTPLLMFDPNDKEKNISSKYMIMEFIESGGNIRIKMFKNELEAISKTKGFWIFTEDGAGYADKLLNKIK